MGYKETVDQLVIGFKKSNESFGREVLCNILMEFGIPAKQVRLIRMCFNENYSKVQSPSVV
jgi:hypothetical protein